MNGLFFFRPSYGQTSHFGRLLFPRPDSIEHPARILTCICGKEVDWRLISLGTHFRLTCLLLMVLFKLRTLSETRTRISLIYSQNNDSRFNVTSKATLSLIFRFRSIDMLMCALSHII